MSLFASFIGGHNRSQSVVANPSTLQNLYAVPLPGSMTGRALCFASVRHDRRTIR